MSACAGVKKKTLDKYFTADLVDVVETAKNNVVQKTF